jgi:predicted  nucleic acid-binding Zn-ribbon protein
MSASLGLFRLQQVDRQIDRVQSQLDTIRKTLENDVALRDALARVEHAQKGHHQARHQFQLAEAEAEGQQIKIQHAESSLYGGSVHNPKELQDLQKDIESLKRHLGTLEDRELNALEQAEEAEKALTASRADLEELRSQLGDQNGKLLDEQDLLLKDLERLAEEREAALTPIESRLVETYELLRRQKRGVAVTEVTDNSCASCGSSLNASTLQNARSSAQIAHCPSCGRILFAS